MSTKNITLPATTDLWDAALLPLEVAETTDNIICTIWLHKLSVQSLNATYTPKTLVISLTATMQQTNTVTYAREIQLSTAVASVGANITLNDMIATITLPKAKANLAQRLLNNLDAALHLNRRPTLLSVKAL